MPPRTLFQKQHRRCLEGQQVPDTRHVYSAYQDALFRRTRG
jgi:hypothetical protein